MMDKEQIRSQENTRRATVACGPYPSTISQHLSPDEIPGIMHNDQEGRKLSLNLSAAKRRVSFGDLPNPGVKPGLEFNNFVGKVIPSAIKEHDTPEDSGEKSAEDFHKIMTDDGSAITVVEFDKDTMEEYDEHLSKLINSFNQTNLNCFIVHLGMLGQHTIYNVKFSLPESKVMHENDWAEEDQTKLDSMVEFLNYTDEGTKFVKGLSLELNAITSVKSINGHQLDLKIVTNNVSHINEPFILRNSTDKLLRTVIIFKATALGKNHGTPMLRVGIHKIDHTPEYMESDVKTEWQGFKDELEGL